VVLVPLALATAVTLWSLEQARYRPKGARRQRPTEPPPPTEPATGSSEPAPPRSA